MWGSLDQRIFHFGQKYKLTLSTDTCPSLRPGSAFQTTSAKEQLSSFPHALPQRKPAKPSPGGCKSPWRLYESPCMCLLHAYGPSSAELCFPVLQASWDATLTFISNRTGAVAAVWQRDVKKKFNYSFPMELKHWHGVKERRMQPGNINCCCFLLLGAGGLSHFPA